MLLLLALSGGTAGWGQSTNHQATKPPARVPDAEPTATARPVQLLAAPASERAAAENFTNEALGEMLPTEADATPNSTPSQFRVERMSLAGGAELLTIFGRADGLRVNGKPAPEVPLVSVVRDTLGDNNVENDRLRYVWMLTYTEPTLLKRIAAAVPFLYQHLGNKTRASNRLPVPLIDLANADRQTWKNLFWAGLQNVVLDNFGLPLRASSRTYRRNADDYYSAHVTQALTILSVYERWRQRARDESELLASSQPSLGDSLLKTNLLVDDREGPLLRAPAFTTGEMLELRARLILSGRPLGGLFGLANFHDTVAKSSTKTTDTSGHNWELLRQRAEAEGLYFEPLTMPDGSATHALLWIAKGDREAQANRHFDGRFLNIADPWNDQRLSNWGGYSQTRYFDSDGRPTNAGAPQARPMEMIPLALYGLDHPRIPALLIDFRDNLNPKRRELTRRLVRDVAKNILPLTTVGHVVSFLGRAPYDWITGRRGMDVNQPSRLRSYSELKLLLAFDGSIEPGLRSEIARRLESVSLNPLSNDSEGEIRLARQQYDSLVDFARRSDGLPAKIERDRRAEMVPLKHGLATRLLFNLGNVLTLGRYVHRETATPELSARMELARRIQNHTRLLREVAKSSPQIEVAWDMTTVTRSLRFVVDNGSSTDKEAARAAAAIFTRTSDAEARRLCLDALGRINNKTARNELLRLYHSEEASSEWRVAIAERLRKAVAENGGMKPAEAESLRSQVGQP